MAPDGFIGGGRVFLGWAVVAQLGGAAVGEQGEGQAVGFGKEPAAGQGRLVAGVSIPLAFVFDEFERALGLDNGRISLRESADVQQQAGRKE